jgi:peroxiredoxin
MKKIILAVFVLASVMASARTAPSFRGDLLTGGSLSLREALKPNRALLVCFWASWCVPCMKELKLVKEGLAANPSLPLDVITINEDTSDTAADIKPTLKLHGLNFPVILDPKKEIFSRYQTEQALPFSVLLSPSGEILATFKGLHEDDMLNEIKSHLGTPHAE